MKIKVISEFYDKFRTSVLYKEGTVLDFEEERAKNLISRKLAVEVKPETPKVKKETPKTSESAKEEVKVQKPKQAEATETKVEVPKKPDTEKADEAEKQTEEARKPAGRMRKND